MITRNFYFWIFGAAVLILGMILYTNNVNVTSESNSYLTTLPDSSNINTLKFSSTTDTTILKKSKNIWKLNNGEIVKDIMVIRVWELLYHLQLVYPSPKSERQKLKHEIDNGIELELIENERNKYILKIGKSTDKGTWIMAHGDTIPMLVNYPGVVNNLHLYLSPTESFWMENLMIRIPKFKFSKIVCKSIENQKKDSFEVDCKTKNVIGIANADNEKVKNWLQRLIQVCKMQEQVEMKLIADENKLLFYELKIETIDNETTNLLFYQVPILNSKDFDLNKCVIHNKTTNEWNYAKYIETDKVLKEKKYFLVKQ